MAGIDYKKCDLCSERVFYDSDLNYEYDERYGYGHPYFKIAGGQQNKLKLGNLGDWAVLCSECSKTHKTQIVLIK